MSVEMSFLFAVVMSLITAWLVRRHYVNSGTLSNEEQDELVYFSCMLAMTTRLAELMQDDETKGEVIDTQLKGNPYFGFDMFQLNVIATQIMTAINDKPDDYVLSNEEFLNITNTFKDLMEAYDSIK